jgi:hypothetical protein
MDAAVLLALAPRRASSGHPLVRPPDDESGRPPPLSGRRTQLAVVKRWRGAVSGGKRRRTRITGAAGPGAARRGVAVAGAQVAM